MKPTHQPFNSGQLAAQTVLPVLSILFDRFSYYGVRSFLLIYAATAFNFEKPFVSLIYSYLLYVPLMLRPFGGLLADRVLGYRKAMAIGNLLMVVGCFVMVLPFKAALIAGLGLIILSNSIYSPATYTQLLKVYNGNDKQRDGALVVLYLAINIGAFFGPILMAIAGVDVHFQLGFILAGIASMIALVFSLLCTEKLPAPLPSQMSALATGKRISIIIGMVISCILFWIVFEYQSLQLKAYLSLLRDTSYLTSTIGPLSCIVFASILGLIWYFVSFSSKIKWILGFTVALLGICLIVFTQYLDDSITWMIIGSILFSLAEIFTISIQSKLIQRYASDKYLATTVAIALSLITIISSLSMSSLMLIFYDGWTQILMILAPLLAAILFVKFGKDPSQTGEPDHSLPMNESELLDQ